MKHITILLTTLLAVTAATASEPLQPPYNWRGINGTVVFPAGGIVTQADDAKGQNIVWKTTLPFYGNNSAVYAAGRVFVLTDAGGKSDAPLLHCLDVSTGQILWEQPVDNLDDRPAEQAAWASAQRQKQYAMTRRAREEAGQVVGTMLWTEAGKDSNAILHEEGAIYHLSRSGSKRHDALTGAVQLNKTETSKSVGRGSTIGPIIAGNYLISLTTTDGPGRGSDSDTFRETGLVQFYKGTDLSKVGEARCSTTCPRARRWPNGTRACWARGGGSPPPVPARGATGCLFARTTPSGGSATRSSPTGPRKNICPPNQPNKEPLPCIASFY